MTVMGVYVCVFMLHLGYGLVLAFNRRERKPFLLLRQKLSAVNSGGRLVNGSGGGV